jgi:preprotein translocase subunit SecA
LIGAVERVLGTALNGKVLAVSALNWQSIGDLLVEKVQEQFKDRLEVYFNDPEEARITKSLDAGLKEIQQEVLTESDLVHLLGLMAEGRQAAFDKKSHKRIWLRTQRLRYTFYAADLLLQMDQEKAREDILAHLEKAQLMIQDAWGKNEMERLKEVQLSSLEEDLRIVIQEKLGEDSFQNLAGQKLDLLPGDIKTLVQDELGHSTVTNIYRELFLRVISELWVEYLTEMEALRVAIGLEAYAQRDPLVQYKTKGFEMFQHLMEDMRMGVVNRMFTFQPRNVSRIQAAVEEGASGPKDA